MPVVENNVGMQLDNIIVATDFEPESEIVTDYARLFAKHCSSKLTVAHIVDLSVASRSEAAVIGLVINQMRHNSAEQMDRTLNKLHDAGVRAHGKILEAHNPGEAVMRLANEVGAYMIVMGTHARHGLSKLALGSCAEGVIHHAQCPVITLGPKVKKTATRVLNIGTIVFATDLYHDTAEKAGVALEFAKDTGAKIYMCHVLQHSGKNFGDAIESQLKTESALCKLIPQSTYEWCSPEVIVEHGQVGDHILQLARRVNADLIVMGAHRRATWFTHLAEGVVEHVLAEAECPVMTICTD